VPGFNTAREHYGAIYLQWLELWHIRKGAIITKADQFFKHTILSRENWLIYYHDAINRFFHRIRLLGYFILIVLNYVIDGQLSHMQLVYL
jgi:hypothetical protein